MAEEQATESVENRSSFLELKKDKLLFSLFIIIILLGVAVRIIYPTEPGLWNDDASYLPTSLLWFYPHDYYPGLSGQGESAFGNMIIGASCMLSGEDFSGVTKITSMFFPDRPILLGNLAKAEDYCRIPMYAFGIFFFALIIVLAFMLLDKYAALFTTAFFAFYQFLLQYSRWIHTDVILYTFIAAGLIFLWQFYIADKYRKKEVVYLCCSAAFFALSFGTKIPALVYIALPAIVFLNKYADEALSLLKTAAHLLGLSELATKIRDRPANMKLFYARIAYSAITYLLVLLPLFEFSLKNAWLVIQKYRTVDISKGALFGTFGINKHFFGLGLHEFFMSLNILDIAIFFVAIIVLIKLAKKKRDKSENFIFMMAIFFLFTALFFSAINLLRVFFSFAIGFLFVMALVLSDKPYSLFGMLNLSSNVRRRIFLIIIVAYIALAGYSAFSDAPYFAQKNWLVCKLTDCGVSNYRGLADSQTGEFLAELLKNNTVDTFDSMSSLHMAYYYIHPEEAYLIWQFKVSFKQQIGRWPTVLDKIQYYHPKNRTLRYLVIMTDFDYGDQDADGFVKDLQVKYEPSYRIVLRNNIEPVWIYDLKNLTLKK